ncbi:B-cell receptor-associated protein 31, isoform CRA_b [Mus musculus]|nr:B-cell receptor-associated protein 31, isoform CRA_b [Mus musculus]
MSLQWTTVATFLYAEVFAVLLLCIPFISPKSLLRRLVTLISQQATLLASNEAFKKQAESASEAAKKYMEENDQLKKGAAEDGDKLDIGNTEMKLEENKSLKNDLRKLKDELASTKKKLEKAENEALAMQKQSEGLTKEYDRLLEEHAKLQASVRGPSVKKEE